MRVSDTMPFDKLLNPIHAKWTTISFGNKHLLNAEANLIHHRWPSPSSQLNYPGPPIAVLPLESVVACVDALVHEVLEV